MPSRREWALAAKRSSALIGAGVGFVVADSQLRNLANWFQRHGWRELDRFLWTGLNPIELAVFVTLVTGLVWTAGRLLVQAIPAARASFRSAGLALTEAARRHATLTKTAFPWLPGLVFSSLFLLGHGTLSAPSLGPRLAGLTLVWLTSYALCRKPAAAFAALPAEPARAEDPGPSVKPSGEAAPRGERSFAAIAVTRRTKGIVGAATVGTAAMVIAALFAKTSPVTAVSLVGYAGVMLVAVAALRRSRVVVGIDGVLILGADAPRFLPYADHDEVRQDGGDLLLLRRGRVKARLQLDETDRARAPQLVERLRAAMTLAAKMTDEGADHAVRPLVRQEGGSQLLASKARGTNYRTPAVVREQLWALVEGPLCDAETRLLVAEALTQDLREGERPRLRVAARACAEPRVRIALERLGGEEAGEAELPDDQAEPAKRGAVLMR